MRKHRYQRYAKWPRIDRLYNVQLAGWFTVCVCVLLLMIPIVSAWMGIAFPEIVFLLLAAVVVVASWGIIFL